MSGYSFRDGNLGVSFPPSVGVNSKRKEFAPEGANSFLLRVDPILEGLSFPENKHIVTEVASLCKNGGKKGGEPILLYLV